MSLLFFILTIIIVISIIFIIYKIIVAKMDHLRMKQVKRVIELSKSEAGKKFLENEQKFRNERYKKMIPLILIGNILCYSILLFAGFGGLYILIHENLIKSKNMDIFQRNKIYFIVSPIIILYSLYQIIQTIRSYIGRKF